MSVILMILATFLLMTAVVAGWAWLISSAVAPNGWRDKVRRLMCFPPPVAKFEALVTNVSNVAES